MANLWQTDTAPGGWNPTVKSFTPNNEFKDPTDEEFKWTPPPVPVTKAAPHGPGQSFLDRGPLLQSTTEQEEQRKESLPREWAVGFLGTVSSQAMVATVDNFKTLLAYDPNPSPDWSDGIAGENEGIPSGKRHIPSATGIAKLAENLAQSIEKVEGTDLVNVVPFDLEKYQRHLDSIQREYYHRPQKHVSKNAKDTGLYRLMLLKGTEMDFPGLPSTPTDMGIDIEELTAHVVTYSPILGSAFALVLECALKRFLFSGLPAQLEHFLHVIENASSQGPLDQPLDSDKKTEVSGTTPFSFNTTTATGSAESHTMLSRSSPAEVAASGVESFSDRRSWKKWAEELLKQGQLGTQTPAKFCPTAALLILSAFLDGFPNCSPSIPGVGFDMTLFHLWGSTLTTFELLSRPRAGSPALAFTAIHNNQWVAKPVLLSVAKALELLQRWGEATATLWLVFHDKPGVEHTFEMAKLLIVWKLEAVLRFIEILTMGQNSRLEKKIKFLELDAVTKDTIARTPNPPSTVNLLNGIPAGARDEAELYFRSFLTHSREKFNRGQVSQHLLSSAVMQQHLTYIEVCHRFFREVADQKNTERTAINLIVQEYCDGPLALGRHFVKDLVKTERDRLAKLIRML